MKNDGTVFSWGKTRDAAENIVTPAELTDVDNGIENPVREIFTTESAFVALRNDCTVVAWGDENDGGIIPSGFDVSYVKTVYSTARAFAALDYNNEVVAWGDEDYGGTVTSGLDVTNVEAIYSTAKAFAALKQKGSQVTWGYKKKEEKEKKEKEKKKIK